MSNGSCNTSVLQTVVQTSFHDFILSAKMCRGIFRHHVPQFSFSPLRAGLRTKCQVAASCSITLPPFCGRGKQKSLQSINRKGQTQMFRWKTDDTKNLVEYSTSGICLLATTGCSIFQRKKISSVAVTVQHRCRIAKGGDIKWLNIITPRPGITQRQGSSIWFCTFQ